MELLFYPLDFDYKVRDGKVYVYLYGKTSAGEQICVIHNYEPYFYAAINHKELLERLLPSLIIEAQEPAKATHWEEVEKELLGRNNKFMKIYVNYPKAVPLLSKALEEQGIACYEKDIIFTLRYIRDLSLTPNALTKASSGIFLSSDLSVPLFHADAVEPVGKEHPSLCILAIDIETYAVRKEIDPYKNPILMIAFYVKSHQRQKIQKVLTWKSFDHEFSYIEHLPNEKALLQRFRELILQYNPDILTGYFSDGFDLPYLKIRAALHNITLDFGRDHSELIAASENFRDGESKIRGLVHLDVLKFVRNIFGKDLKTDSYTLDAVSAELLGHKKHPVNLDLLATHWDNTTVQLGDFCAYNLHDAKLTYLLCEKLLPDMIEFSKIVAVPLFDLIRMRFSRLVESYILKRAQEYNILAPNKPPPQEAEQRMEESYEGGFVFEPTPGLYQDLVVFDFRSLYPTIISAHNISPESFHQERCQNKKAVPGIEQYWFCQDKKAFLPTILEDLILMRADLKRLIKEEKKKGADTKLVEARSYSLKILANSFYGYLGFYGARWYSFESARSTTALARNYIKQTIEKGTAHGFPVIYGDTDSYFILVGDKPLAAALQFMEEINQDLPGQMELELQGYYPSGIFVAAKGSEKETKKNEDGTSIGAKKKYALLNPDGTLKITGFETVRRNWSKIAKEVQEKVLRMVLQDQSAEAMKYAREIAADLKRGLIPNEKLIIKTQITREIGSYSSVGPHVAIAQRLQERGEKVLPGTMVEYIIAKGQGLIRERAKLPSEIGSGQYDQDYYLHHQLLPAVSSILGVFGYKEEDIFSDSSQVGLAKFF